MNPALSIIGAPSSAGAYAPGQERAPRTFRDHGLIPALRSAGCNVEDRGDTALFRWRPDRTRPMAMNLEAVRDTAAAVADQVAEVFLAGGNALVLGGDCTVELGTVAGARRCSDSVGLVYIDLDVDLNPPSASDGALDWTVVAHLVDLPGAELALSALGSRRPLLSPRDVFFFGTGNVERDEGRTLRELAFPQKLLSEVRADPVAAANAALAWADGYECLLVHLDVDVLSYIEFPIAENVRRVEGLALHELAAALSVLLSSPRWRALTVTEVNPDHAPDEAKAFAALVGMLAGALARPKRS